MIFIISVKIDKLLISNFNQQKVVYCLMYCFIFNIISFNVLNLLNPTIVDSSLFLFFIFISFIFYGRTLTNQSSYYQGYLFIH